MRVYHRVQKIMFARIILIQKEMINKMKVVDYNRKRVIFQRQKNHLNKGTNKVRQIRQRNNKARGKIVNK